MKRPLRLFRKTAVFGIRFDAVFHEDFFYKSLIFRHHGNLFAPHTVIFRPAEGGEQFRLDFFCFGVRNGCRQIDEAPSRPDGFVAFKHAFPLAFSFRQVYNETCFGGGCNSLPAVKVRESGIDRTDTVQFRNRRLQSGCEKA